MSDDARRAVLARRAKFVAAALASIGVACGKTDGSGGCHPPGVCLKVAPPSTETAANPCLSVPYKPPAAPDAGAVDASTQPGVDAGTEAGARPHPCLSPPPPGRHKKQPWEE